MATLADSAEQAKAPDLKRKGVDLICDNGAQRSVDGFRSHKNRRVSASGGGLYSGEHFPACAAIRNVGDAARCVLESHEWPVSHNSSIKCLICFYRSSACTFAVSRILQSKSLLVIIFRCDKDFVW